MAPILVVGAGTTGLTLACQLARQGAEVRIVDRAPAIDPRCRACLLRVRTLELLHEMGVADEIVGQSQPVLGTGFYAAGGRMPSQPVRIVGSRFPSPVCLEQWRTERALEGLLRRLGLEVERDAELLGIDDHEDSLLATVRRRGVAEEIRAAWIVGCDGAHSRVRQLRGLEFPGEQDPLTYVVADVVVEPQTPRDEVAVYVGEDAMLMVFPLPDGRSLLCGGDLLADAAASGAPSLDRVRELARQRISPNATLHDARWLGYFRIDYRLASTYRDGRVFLAGDAAHVYSPVGGQGMNTGIQDACNLAWKLALVSSGQGREALLESYERERRPVAQDVLTNTRLLTEHLKLVMEIAAPFRQALLQTVALAEGQEQLARHTEQLDLDYGAGTAAEEGAFAAGPRPGQQAPDVASLVRDGASVRLTEVLRASCHTLLLFPDGSAASWQRLAALQESVGARYGGAVESHVVSGDGAGASSGTTVLGDSRGELRRQYGVDGEGLYLIRPDGYVAYRSQPASARGLCAHLEQTLV